MSVSQPLTPRDRPYVEINLDNIKHNLRQIRSHLPEEIGIIAVVKDHAYGCGSVMISRVLEHEGVGFFATATAHEARALRESGIKSPVLVLGPSQPDDLLWGSAADVRFTLNDISEIALWRSMNIPLRFHLNIDTGMGRLGIVYDEIDTVAMGLKSCPRLVFEGLMTHCANADNPDPALTDLQMRRFKKALTSLQGFGLKPSLIHYGNSAATMRFPPDICTMVRPGIVLYGCKPDPAQDFPLMGKPVLALKSRVIKMKRVPAKTTISYGSTYVTRADTVIATIAVGYGQGLPRQLSNRGTVLITGKRYTIAGRVTMDYIMVDVGPNPVIAVGDEAVVIGDQETESISPDEVARLCDTIAYEILCGINSRLDRFYLLDGKIFNSEKGLSF
jgi:alanine racemase